MLGGVPTRVVACSPKERADGRKVHVFDIRHFHDIHWQLLVCMPGDPADEPIDLQAAPDGVRRVRPHRDRSTES